MHGGWGYRGAFQPLTSRARTESLMPLMRQHLIDPEVCIRCNTCEETCPIDAITHDKNNYVVLFDKCNWCGDCFTPCPTGAIMATRMVESPHSVEDQFTWESLPPGASADSAAPPPAAMAEIVALAGNGGIAPRAPATAAKPSVHLYDPAAPVLANVQGNLRLTDEGAESDIRHIVLDFGANAFPVLEGQSIGILPPGVDAAGKAHRMRLYSVASPRDGERPGHNNLALTVKRVSGGVASNYVCDLKKGDTVKVCGPYGTSFLMPDDPAAHIMMICTGTGAAPFRGMTERRRRSVGGATGRLLLFFGARTQGELPYFGPLTKLPKSLIDVELALSRAKDRPKQYVQDRLRARGSDLAPLLSDSKTHVYICGLKGMEEGCEQAFKDICAKAGADWAILRARMAEDGRFHVETY